MFILLYILRVYYLFQSFQKTPSKLTGVGIERVLSEPNVTQK